MIASPPGDGFPSPVPFPRRRISDVPLSPVDTYLAALDQCLAGQIDPALEANGIYTPLGSVARAALVEAIGADLEAAARDLMLQGVPREDAETRAVASLGPADSLGRDLLIARRRAAVEAWQRGPESVWWWTQPLVPVALTVVAVLLAAFTPTLAVIAGISAEPHVGPFAVALVPALGGLFVWLAGALAPGDPPARR
jgi:hypothetical protein